MAALNMTKRAMSAAEKFFFDLNGFIIVRGALSADEVKQMHTSIDKHLDVAKARSAAALKNTIKDSPMSAQGSRTDMGGMLGWEDGEMFRRLLVHRNLSYYLTDLLGEGYRLDHQPMVLIQDKESEGFMLHGGPVSGHDGVPEGRFNPELQYRCHNGTIWNSLLAMSVCLTDSKEGDGGWCGLRGSHKMNFAVPNDFIHGMMDGFKDHIWQPAVKAGDVILFSEGVLSVMYFN